MSSGYRETTASELELLVQDLVAEDVEAQTQAESQVNAAQGPVPDHLLHTDPDAGLSHQEVASRRIDFGLNHIHCEKSSPILKFLALFWGPTPVIMALAASLAALLRHWLDMGILFGLLLLNAIVSFIQEFHAGQVVNELKKQFALKATVIRQAARVEIDAVDIVPGDVLVVEHGDIVAADARVVDGPLQVDQSSLTGESLAVEKHKGDVCYSSSVAKRGSTRLIVSATGKSTFVGQAAALAHQAGNDAGRFNVILNHIGLVLMTFVLLTMVIVWASAFYTQTADRLLESTLIITIVGVPVGLPAVVMTTLAVGASFLARKQAVVQRLAAVESLAGVETLCCDKTGTLTQNKLTMFDTHTLPGIDVEDLLFTAAMACSHEKKGLEAIDKVIIKSLAQHSVARRNVTQSTVVEFHPFDPVSKKATAVVSMPTGQMTCVKGAPSAVLKTVEKEHNVPQEEMDAYNGIVEDYASRGFRSIGAARKQDNAPWELLGIIALFDPPREDTAETILEAQQLGLSIKMLTGDAVGIARETCRQLGIGTNVLDAEALQHVGTGDALYDLVSTADGFAGVHPQHKYQVVEALQRRGRLVAMCGDGVNDVPSLRRADAGIAVSGASGAARSAADLLFLAPGLSAIIDATKVSRQIFHRVQAYIVYRIALSIHLLVFLGAWMVVSQQSLPVDLVAFLAIFADIATLMIAYDNAPVAARPMLWNLPRLWGLAVMHGLALALATAVLLITTMHVATQPVVHTGIVASTGNMHSVLFLEIALTQNWLIFVTRTHDGRSETVGSGRSRGNWPSWQLCLAVGVVDALATVICSHGWFGGAPGTDGVTVLRVWAWSVGVIGLVAGVHWGLTRSGWFDCLTGVARGQSYREGYGEKTA